MCIRDRYPRSQIVLTGGLTKTPELGQLLADVLQTPVVLPAAADEGTAFGAALMAKFRLQKIAGQKVDWSEFVKGKQESGMKQFVPDEAVATDCATHYDQYRELVSSISE